MSRMDFLYRIGKYIISLARLTLLLALETDCLRTLAPSEEEQASRV